MTFGEREAIFQSTDRKFENGHEILTFEWRGCNTLGQLSTGLMNTGWVHCLGVYDIEGQIYNFFGRNFGFKGRRIENRYWRGAQDLRNGWHSYKYRKHHNLRMCLAPSPTPSAGPSATSSPTHTQSSTRTPSQTPVRALGFAPKRPATSTPGLAPSPKRPSLGHTPTGPKTTTPSRSPATKTPPSSHNSKR